MTGSQTELPTSELDVRSGPDAAEADGGAKLPEQPTRSYVATPEAGYVATPEAGFEASEAAHVGVSEAAFVGKAAVPGQMAAPHQPATPARVGPPGPGPMSGHLGLAEAARVLAGRLRDRPGSGGLDVQMLCLAEEAGEVIQAYRRVTGRARREGDWAAVAAELADVVIVAYVTAQLANIDLDAAVAAKLDEIEARGGI